MSLESALDEERREVMNILEGRPEQHRSPADKNGRTSSPAPVRSMLDVGDPAAPRHGSIAGTGVGITNLSMRGTPSATGVRSMLDPSTPSPTRTTHSVTTSPTAAHPSNQGLHRAQSDAASHPPENRNRAGSDRDRGSINPQASYQFDMSSSVQGQPLPKRVTQGGKKQSQTLNSMAAILQGQELGPIPRGRDSGRHNSTAGILGGNSTSPSSRVNNRSQSPGGSLLNNNSFNLMPTPGKYLTDAGKVIDMNSAYRRLSDAALLKSGGQLSNLPTKSASHRVRLDSGETLSPTGEVRLQKDYYENAETGEAAIESSDEEHSSDDDGWGASGIRGRRRGRRKKGAGGTEADTEDSEYDESLKSRNIGTIGMGRGGGPRMVKSLLAAAEEERKYAHFPSVTLRMAENMIGRRSKRVFQVQGQIIARARCHNHRPWW